MDVRDRFVQQVVKGKSFAEVGGLWGTVSEKASVAHAAGATELTMIDVTPLGTHWWLEFEKRRQALNVPPVRSISGDVMQLAETDPSLRFDVVHCSGILYHVPNPLHFLKCLRTITREYLVLTSSITETEIANSEGRLTVPTGSALFLPALSPAEKAVLKAHWSDVVPDNAKGLTLDIASWRLEDFGPWWWLPTADALAAMCRVVGFDVLGVELTWNGHAATLLLQVTA
jgi:hypothetical protein